VTATADVYTVVIYLDDVMSALRNHEIAVETGFVGANRQAGRSISITLGHSPSSLSYATLAWEPVVGWSLTSKQARPRQWVLPLGVQASPGDIAAAIKDLMASLRMPAAT
jgi:hypothetical protein